MTPPSNLPPLAQDDEIGAKAQWTRQLLTTAGSRIYTAMMRIHEVAQELIDDEADPDQARDDVVYCCIDATCQHLITKFLAARTLGQLEEANRIEALIQQLDAFQDQLDPE
jgi:hypothetical protein